MLNTHVKLAPACCFGDEAVVGSCEQADLFRTWLKHKEIGGFTERHVQGSDDGI